VALASLSMTPSPATTPDAYFSLHFSDVCPTNTLLNEALTLSLPAGLRSAADLLHFLVRCRSLHPFDGALAPIVCHFGAQRWKWCIPRRWPPPALVSADRALGTADRVRGQQIELRWHRPWRCSEDGRSSPRVQSAAVDGSKLC
jgi:hypothetical protein